MNDCIFCKIIKREIPCNKIYEDKDIFAFLDNNPVNKGHTLIIPKKHFENIYETPDKIISKMILGAKKLSIIIKKTMKSDGINVYMNNGRAAGQQVEHAHIHVIPRLEKDGFTYWKNKKKYSDEEMSEIKNKITQAL